VKVFEVEQQIEKLELRMPVIGFCTRLIAGGGLLSLGAVFFLDIYSRTYAMT